MTSYTSSLPVGPYQATLLSRRTLPPMGNAGARDNLGVEMTVRISVGPHTGQQLPFRVYGAARVQRARMFAQGQLLRIHVVHRQLDDGRLVARVADFGPLGSATAVDLLQGVGRHDPDHSPTTAAPDQLAVSPPDGLVERLRAAVVGVGAEQHGPLTQQASAIAPLVTPVEYDAISEEYQLGFFANRKRATRTLAHFEAAFNGFAGADERLLALGEGYLSVCQYSHDLMAYRDSTEKKSLAGYRGATWARWLAIDLDGDGSPEGLEQTLDNARTTVAVLVTLGIPRSHVLVFFSGNRGVHILFPSAAFAAPPRTCFEKVVGIVCGMIAGLAGVTIDESLYTPLKPLRAHNTRHDGTGLYKVLIGQDELEAVTSETVLELARQPKPFQVPDWRVTAVSLLVELWQWACRVDEAPQQATPVAGRTPTHPTGEPHLFADTLDLIVHGAPEGSRATRFFKASMNLLDFDCPEELLVALLEPAARLSNFPDDEFVSQIQGAMKAHALTRTSKSA